MLGYIYGVLGVGEIMTLDQLKTLQAVVEESSLKAAAERLHKTQPTISVAIKNLESELGVAIFHRDQYRNQLTHEGQALYEKAKLILMEVNQFSLLGKQLALGEEAEVGVAFDSAIPIHLILKVVRACKEKFPRTRLTIFSENAYGSLERLQSGDAALVVMPWLKYHEDLQSFLFLNLTMKFVIKSDHILLEKYNVIPKQIMRSYPQVIITDSSREPHKMKYGVLEGGDHWRVNDYQTKKEIILQGMGWGSLPEHLVDKEIQQGQLAQAEIQGLKSSVTIPIHAVRLENGSTGPVANYLWELFQSHAIISPNEMI